MSTYKKVRRALVCFLILFFLSGNTTVSGMEIDSKAAILIDQTTGRILFEKNSKERLPIASTTKIMTSILAMELVPLQEKAIISKHTAEVGEASIDLIEGETITLLNLLLGTMIKSGNDAAVAIAELVAGSEAEFANMMNKKALLIGAYNTHFVNPNGLPADNHYSTAYDLALIANYAMKNSLFRDIVSIKSATIPYGNYQWNRYLKNTNKLLREYPYATGIKTGTTNAAGPCLVASATKNNTKLIAVVLNSRDRFQQTAQLFNWGFANFETKNIYLQGEIIHQEFLPEAKGETLDIMVSEDVAITFNNNEKKAYDEKLNLYPVQLPIKKGSVVGQLIISVDAIEINVDLIAANTVETKSFWERMGLKRIINF
ncbi:MAG: D-alanyl-D-alanine carboxypeptidase family protein [Bacillota bacterium]|nr:D-alanyl-D-alanine carboxypeptidase family protein [Bacillota bacterium]